MRGRAHQSSGSDCSGVETINVSSEHHIVGTQGKNLLTAVPACIASFRTRRPTHI
jgi:hypothetical protein